MKADEGSPLSFGDSPRALESHPRATRALSVAMVAYLPRALEFHPGAARVKPWNLIM
jgi:hypothetical protein